jgi:SAM-dependent methyltransferase
VSDLVLWHDIECGGYDADLPLWRQLAAQAGGPVLDVGAGTGRVALDLAARGHEVVALDVEPALLEVLRERAGERRVETVAADAAAFALDRRFALIVVPMQTVQLLGEEGRRSFLRCAAAHLAPGGLLAIALADALESFDSEVDAPPLPDIREVDGWVYASRPLAVVDEGDRVAIHRLREVVTPAGERSTHDDVIRLDRVDAETLAREGAEAGLRAEPAQRIAETDEYVGSTVVMLRG